VGQEFAVGAFGADVPIDALAAVRLASLAPAPSCLYPNSIEPIGAIRLTGHVISRVQVLGTAGAEEGIHAHVTSMSAFLTLALLILEEASLTEAGARAIRLRELIAIDARKALI